MIALNLCFGIIACPVRDTTLPISESSSDVELFMACLWSHNHLTSIIFSSGDLVGRNTNCILGWYLARFSHTLFDLCINKFQYQKYLFDTASGSFRNHCPPNLLSDHTTCFFHHRKSTGGRYP